MSGKLIAWVSLVFALIQSYCSAILVVSRIRTLIGMAPLAAAAGGYAPASGIHANAIRIPMMALALIGVKTVEGDVNHQILNVSYDPTRELYARLC